MNRRKFFVGLGAAAVACRGSWSEVHVTIDPTRLGRAIPADFLGLGYEITSVNPASLDCVQFVRTLGSNGVVRVGGNTSDIASLAPDAASIEALGSFLRATGWKLIWGLNLGTGTPESAANQAAAVAQAAGDRLLCFQIGNEPDLFVNNGLRPPGYDYAGYLQEFGRFAAGLNDPLAGPDTANSPDWLASFAAGESADVQFLTEHYYRAGAGDPAATISSLLNQDPRFDAMVRQLPPNTRLCEVNSFSGGGKPGVSDTFASALWGLDLMFTLAAAGGRGINWETGLNQLGFVSSYSPIFQDESGNFSARPLYYALLAFSRAGTGRLIAAQNDAAGLNFKSYATRDNSGVVWVTLINKDISSGVGAQIRLGSGLSLAEVWPLAAPAASATAEVSFAGAQVSSAGTWRPAVERSIRVTAGSLEVEVPAASGAVIRAW